MSKIIRKVIKQGNSYAITIPVGFLNYIGAKQKDYVALFLRHPGEIVITRHDAISEQTEVKIGE